MSLYLSRLVLNPRSREVQRDLIDVHELHRTIMTQFDPDKGNRATQQILYRLEYAQGIVPTLLVQSTDQPHWSLNGQHMLACPATKDIEPALETIHTGQNLRFRLRANPTKREAASTRTNAPRIPLTRWEDRARWLTRKLADAGATPNHSALNIASQPRDTGRNKNHRITIWPVLFEGILTVEDPRLLRQAITAGIGPARAYGNGLLSIAPSP
jgi:CRISPR system Cascade subunit CasE